MTYEALITAKNLKDFLLDDACLDKAKSKNEQPGLPSFESMRTYAELAQNNAHQLSPSLMAVQIMRYPVTFFTPETSIAEAKEAFTSLGFNVIPIADRQERLLSLVTKESVMRVSHNAANEPLLSLAQDDCISATPGTLISQLGLVMQTHGLPSMVISDDEGTLLGMVSFNDALSAMQIKAYDELV